MIKLTIIDTRLTEEAEDKVWKAYEDKKSVDDTPEPDWEALGIPNPKGRSSSEDNEFIKLDTEKDFEDIEKVTYIDPLDISIIEEIEDDLGSKIYTKFGVVIEVSQKPKYIYDKRRKYLVDRK